MPLSAADRMDIAETKYLYGFAIDTRDYDLLARVFAPDVHFDMTRYLDGVGAWTMSRHSWIHERVAPLLNGLHATQHSFTNPIVNVTDTEDEVRLRMQMQAHHVLEPSEPQDFWTIGGWYDDRLIRSSDGPRGWVTTGFSLVTSWERGDRSVLARAVQ